MSYKFSYIFSDNQKADKHLTSYADSKQEVIDDLRNVCESFGLTSNCLFNLDDSIDVKLNGNRWNLTGRATPMQQQLSRQEQLKVGDVFRCIGEGKPLRIVTKVFETDLVAPSTEDESPAETLPWFLSRTFTAIILYTEK